MRRIINIWVKAIQRESMKPHKLINPMPSDRTGQIITILTDALVYMRDTFAAAWRRYRYPIRIDPMLYGVKVRVNLNRYELKTTFDDA